MVLLMAEASGSYYLLNTAVLGALDSCNNYRCDSDVSFFDTFCISPGRVSYSPITSRITFHTHCSPSHFIEPDSPNLQKTKRLVSHSKVSSVVHIPSNRLEVTVHRAYHEEYSMSQTNHNGSDDNVEGCDEN